MELVRLAHPAPASDLDDIAELEAGSFSNPWTREMLARGLEPPTTARVYLARLPEVAVAAFCSCWVLVDELHVNTIAVRPEHRRQGVARALMRYVLDETGREGVRRATLEVRRSNLSAQRLYEALGFEVAAVRPGYYTQPVEDALILWRGCDAGPPSPEGRGARS